MLQIAWGIVAIVAGLVFCFRGYLAMRLVIGVWGMFVGFGLGMALVAAWSEDPPLDGALGWIAAIVGALLLGWLAYAFYAVAVVLSIGSVGFALGVVLAGFLTEAQWVHITLGVVGAALLIALALLTNMPELLLILVAASGGASAVITGVLLLMGSVTTAQLEADTIETILADHWWINLIYLGLFLAGLFTQLRRRSGANLRSHYHHH